MKASGRHGDTWTGDVCSTCGSRRSTVSEQMFLTRAGHGVQSGWVSSVWTTGAHQPPALAAFSRCVIALFLFLISPEGKRDATGQQLLLRLCGVSQGPCSPRWSLRKQHNQRQTQSPTTHNHFHSECWEADCGLVGFFYNQTTHTKPCQREKKIKQHFIDFIYVVRFFHFNFVIISVLWDESIWIVPFSSLCKLMIF